MLGRLGNKQGAEGSLLSILTIIIVITLIICATPSGVEERASSLFFVFSTEKLSFLGMIEYFVFRLKISSASFLFPFI